MDIREKYLQFISQSKFNSYWNFHFSPTGVVQEVAARIIAKDPLVLSRGIVNEIGIGNDQDHAIATRKIEGPDPGLGTEKVEKEDVVVVEIETVVDVPGHEKGKENEEDLLQDLESVGEEEEEEGDDIGNLHHHLPRKNHHLNQT